VTPEARADAEKAAEAQAGGGRETEGRTQAARPPVALPAGAPLPAVLHPRLFVSVLLPARAAHAGSRAIGLRCAHAERR
jgi:hypothetical protein